MEKRLAHKTLEAVLSKPRPGEAALALSSTSAAASHSLIPCRLCLDRALKPPIDPSTILACFYNCILCILTKRDVFVAFRVKCSELLENFSGGRLLEIPWKHQRDCDPLASLLGDTPTQRRKGPRNFLRNELPPHRAFKQHR
eukprot:5103590-Pleurochrysis_carterae.AAC.1